MPIWHVRRLSRLGNRLIRQNEQTNPRAERLFVALMIFCALALVGCSRAPQPSAEIAAEIHALQDRTITAEASLQSPASIRVAGMSVRGDWKIHSSSTSTQYFEAVKERLAGDFRVLSQTESSLTMTKAISGDSYSLSFEDPNGGSTIDVHFVATSD